MHSGSHKTKSALHTRKPDGKVSSTCQLSWILWRPREKTSFALKIVIKWVRLTPQAKRAGELEVERCFIFCRDSISSGTLRKRETINKNEKALERQKEREKTDDCFRGKIHRRASLEAVTISANIPSPPYFCNLP